MTTPMDKNQLVDALCERKLTRREINKALAAVGIGVMTLPLTQRMAQANVDNDPDLLVFEWAGYEDQKLHPAYVEKYGKTPSYAFFGEEEEALTKLRAGYRADISHPCTYSTRRWREAGVLKPIDTSRLAHWDDIFPSLRELPGSIDEDGNNYFLPFDWGNSSVLYRTDLVDPEYLEEESWAILFDERYKKRLATYDSVDGVMGVVGVVIGAEDPFNMTDEEFKQAEEMLRKQQKLMRFYWTDTVAIEQALASGELVAAYAWNSSYVNLREQDIPVAYMNPKEGIYTWVCGLVLLKDGKGNEDKAYDYLDAMSAPESGAYMIDVFGYGHSNTKAFDMVPKERLATLGITDPMKHIEGSNFFGEIEPEVRDKYIKSFEVIKVGG